MSVAATEHNVITKRSTRIVRHASRALELTISHSVDAMIAMTLTVGTALYDLGDHALVPMVSGSVSLETQSIFDVFYMGMLLSWLLYIPNLGWLVGRAARAAGGRITLRLWLRRARIVAAKGLVISAAILVAADIAFETLAPHFAVSLTTAMLIIALVSGLFQIMVSALAAYCAERMTCHLSEQPE